MFDAYKWIHDDILSVLQNIVAGIMEKCVAGVQHYLDAGLCSCFFHRIEETTHVSAMDKKP